MKKLLGILVLGLMLSGCAGGNPLASKYKPDGFGGGYSEQQVAKKNVTLFGIHQIH